MDIPDKLDSSISARSNPRNEEQNARRRSILVRNTLVAVLGYLAPMSAIVVVRALGFATYTYWNLAIIFLWILLSGFVFLVAIRSKRVMTIRFINTVAFAELANWVLIYGYLVSFLNEIRLSALLCAFMGIIFLLTSRGFLASLLLSFSTAAVYTAISFYQIRYGHQAGVFPLELMYVCFYFFAAIFVALAADVFARQRKEVVEAKRRAESANRAKSEFLANMSHELRTPLNHIIGFTELVADKRIGELNPTQQEYLSDVLASGKHLLSLINDILDLSKVEAGKMGLEIAEMNIRDGLDSSLGMIKEKAQAHGISLQVDYDGVPQLILADERKLKQVMYNLVSNAVKFTPDLGSIRIAARLLPVVNGRVRTGDGMDFRMPATMAAWLNFQKDLIGISVSDTGIGIASGNLEKIFAPFEQVDGSVTRKYQGTGLGLSLSRSLVELHGGKIWAESEGERKGSTFRFVIPLKVVERS